MWFKVHEAAWIVLHNCRHQAAQSLLYIFSTNCSCNLNQSTKSVPKNFIKMHLQPQSQTQEWIACSKGSEEDWRMKKQKTEEAEKARSRTVWGRRKCARERKRREREVTFFKKKLVKGIIAFSQQLLGAPAKLLSAPSSTQLCNTSYLAKRSNGHNNFLKLLNEAKF